MFRASFVVVLMEIAQYPEFPALPVGDRRMWFCCLAWRGCPSMLTPRRMDLPWALSISDSVGACLETALGTDLVLPGASLPGRSPFLLLLMLVWKLRWLPIRPSLVGNIFRIGILLTYGC